MSDNDPSTIRKDGGVICLVKRTKASGSGAIVAENIQSGEHTITVALHNLLLSFGCQTTCSSIFKKLMLYKSKGDKQDCNKQKNVLLSITGGCVVRNLRFHLKINTDRNNILKKIIPHYLFTSTKKNELT